MYKETTKNLTEKEVKAALMGQTISEYDSWYGSEETMTVDAISMSKSFVKLKGGKTTVSIPVNNIQELIMNGKLTLSSEINHCTVRRIYSINAKPDFQEKIVMKKLEIARLKKELKKLQEDYKNFLASSAQLEQTRKNKRN